MVKLNRELEITKGTRIINYIIDLTFITSVATAINYMFDVYYYKVGVKFIVYLVYYFSFEAYNGQTIGKLFTKTKVVSMYNDKPSVGRILYRTVLRLNPFDVMSYLYGQEQRGHDLLSKTRLISAK